MSWQIGSIRALNSEAPGSDLGTPEFLNIEIPSVVF